ncbi:MAG: S8 family peptidase [Christensenellales bacterium]
MLKEFPFLNILYIAGKPEAIYALSKLDLVKFVSSLSHVSAMVSISKQALQFTQDKYTGKGVTIVYIDTGINPHLDFMIGKKRIIHFVDLINGKTQAYDDNGHGTFVAGVGSGSGFVSNRKFQGFAPNSNIISIKALNDKGEASASKILEAMQWVYSHQSDYNIKVVCMSFGSEPLGYNDPIMHGAEMLWKSGIVVVAAAGNSGPEYETIKSPGISTRIITVGGLNDNRIDQNNFSENFFEIASFSSRGPALKRYKPDLIAPGVEINSCSSDEKFYTKLSGTSVSTPMIAGIVAAAFEKNPNLKPDYVKKKLLQIANQ